MLKFLAIAKKVFVLLLLSSRAICQDFHWLEGKWKEDNSKSLEVWALSGSILKGTGYKLMADGSQKVSEEMFLEKKSGSFVFTSDVAGPQAAVDFTVTTYNSNSFVAENFAHDFPKKISYKRMDANRLEAFISDGGKNVTRFYFTKVND